MALDRTSVVKKADGFARAGKLDLAIAEYRALLGENPADASAANALGDLYARQGAAGLAAEQFIALAEGEWRQGSGAKAIAFYKKALKVSPDCDEALMRLGEITASQSLVADAAKHWNRLADLRAGRHDVAGAEEVRGWLAKLRTRHAGLRTPVSATPAEPTPAPPRDTAASPTVSAPPMPGGIAPAPAAAAEPSAVPAASPPAPRTYAPAAYPALDLPDDEPDVAPTPATIPTSVAPQTAAAASDDGPPAPDTNSLVDVDAWQAPALAQVPTSSRRASATDLDPDDDDLWAAPADSSSAGREAQTADGSTAARAAMPERPAALDAADDDQWEDVTLDLDALDGSDADAGTASDDADFGEGPVQAAGIGDAVEGDLAAADVLRDDSVADPSRVDAHASLVETPADEPLDPGVVRELSAAAETPELRFQAAAQLGRLFVTHGQLGHGITWLQRACDADAPMRERRLEVHYELADALERAGQPRRALEVFADLELEAASYRDVTQRINRLEHQAGAT